MLIPILKDGWIQWVYPWRASEGKVFLMLGDHGNFCPILFELKE